MIVVVKKWCIPWVSPPHDVEKPGRSGPGFCLLQDPLEPSLPGKNVCTGNNSEKTHRT